jgi:hypothetical protein
MKSSPLRGTSDFRKMKSANADEAAPMKLLQCASTLVASKAPIEPPHCAPHSAAQTALIATASGVEEQAARAFSLPLRFDRYEGVQHRRMHRCKHQEFGAQA